MTRRIVTVDMDEPLKIVREIFNNVKIHHLLVVDGQKLAGVVSDRDLLKALSPYIGTVAETPRDSWTQNRKVHQIMSRDLITLCETAAVKDAIDLFITEQISCIPIVNAQGSPVGIVSWRDVLKALA
jgi:acetoin utilization protein AcuB